ncbi:tetratricopeptide repeat family protein [Asticcacaulis biprosthecium C19]|uniref:Tetratricopeptide repeat family protein n=1 Tax=Asticcacaulis biprosthecium C19 TaxID=715226 RepID=F4QRA1_9CAUL|nr:tetratricopeptide repeat protein [Asticcacaulis biprosthecium]EGF90738.1 tetratricopeptide repeat family protein [Asticcacaulis biprosthecium C19]
MTAAATRTDYRQLARQYEAAHDLPSALDAWQHALAEAPESIEIGRHLADIAFRLRLWDMAEKLLAHLILKGARDSVTVTAYAATLREQSRYDEAADLLKTLLGQTPEDSTLWEGLGAVMAAKGDSATAQIFFAEALRLDPNNFHALFNRGCALIDAGELREGLADVRTCAELFRDPTNKVSAGIVSAHTALALGDLKNGWNWFQARHKRGTQAEVHYALKVRLLTTTESLDGKHVFVSAEQGLGDEVLFGSLLPDIAAAIGPNGRLGIGVEPRLVPLFCRSFPNAIVVAHRTRTIDARILRDFLDFDLKRFDTYALVGDFLPVFRQTSEDFAHPKAFLKPDPERVAYWRRYFNGLDSQPKAGILWKSLKTGAERDRHFAGFGLWQDVVATSGVTFVNIQYGDSSVEMAAAHTAGLNIHTPEGIDLKDDLDDLAALCTALDVVIGPSNATTNIAAACGAQTWLVGGRHSWLRLGMEPFPWYPNVRYFETPGPGDWKPALDRVREALGQAL